jgi:enoyl-CoA hydratase/carnithine racemase
VGVVFGHGEHFTAGLDLPASAASPKAGRFRPAVAIRWRFRGPRVSKPVIVAAQGYCLTIGIELMLAADINLCAAYTVAQMEVQRGFSLWWRDLALSSGRRLGQRDALAADRR